MARKATGWTCQRQNDGKKCQYKNPPRTRKCAKCGKARPAKKGPEHQQVLKELPYDIFIEINGGEFCFICELLPPHRRINTKVRFNRDHEHKGFGMPRGLLCNYHNQRLADIDLDEARAIVAFLERAKSPEFLTKVKQFWPKTK